MKRKTIVTSLLLAGALSLMLAARAFAKKSQADLQAQAKVTQEQAKSIALAKVPNGTIKEGDIEKEHGKLVWSFDIATPDSKDITEVQVDANSGEVVSVATETPQDEAKEAKPEKTGKSNHAKTEKDEDDDDDEKPGAK